MPHENYDVPEVTLSPEAFQKLTGEVKRDEASRDLWLQRQATFLFDRFSVPSRNTRIPWPGASTIVMPTIDTAIKRLSSSLVQSTLGPEWPITVRGESPDSVQKEAKVERRLRHMIESRIEHPEREVALAGDLYLQHGHVTIGVAYDRRTRQAREVIYRDRLPGPFADLIPKNALTDEQANLAFRLNGSAPLSQRDISAAEPELRRLLRYHYGLDPKVKADKKTEDAIFRWLVSGSDKPLTIKRREVYRDTPTFFACLPEDTIVHAGVQDEQEAPRITLRQRMPLQEFYARAVDNDWDPGVVRKIRERQGSFGSGATFTKLDYLGQARNYVHARTPMLQGRLILDPRDAIEVLRTYYWQDIDDDGQAERCVLEWTPGCDRPLRTYELPFDFYEFPVVQIRREHTARGWYNTRGVPEVLWSLAQEITEQHRAKLDSMRITNSPTMKARINSGLAAHSNQFIPGQYHWVQRMDDLEPLIFPQTAVSYEREEQILGGWVERLAGIFDASLTDQGRLTRPRTATEISGVTSLQEQSVGSDLLIWHRGWAKVFRMLWALDLQYGPDELWTRVTGDDEPIRQTRHEIQGQFDFQPSTAALQSPVLRLQKAQMIAGMLMQAAQAGIDFGIEYEVKPAEVFRLILKEVDPRVADVAIRRRTPAEIQQIQAQQAQAQQAQQLPPQALEGPPRQVAGRVTQALDAGAAGGVPIEVGGVNGFV